jgi:hypothetical protein
MNKEVKNLHQRSASLSSLLIFISGFIVLVIGYSTAKINDDIKELEKFVEDTIDLQPNFERSLQLYTENTEDAIAFVHSLRPATESEFVEFINTIENLGQAQSLNLELSSLADFDVQVNNSGSESLNYELGFYGSTDDLSKFLLGLRDLPYYMRIVSIDYARLNASKEITKPNITLRIQLYVK